MIRNAVRDRVPHGAERTNDELALSNSVFGIDAAASQEIPVPFDTTSGYPLPELANVVTLHRESPLALGEVDGSENLLFLARSAALMSIVDEEESEVTEQPQELFHEDALEDIAPR